MCGSQQIVKYFFEWCKNNLHNNTSIRLDSGDYFPEEHLIVWLKEVESALEYLRNNGMRHGMVNCRNVLLTEDGHAKLTDYSKLSNGWTSY